MADGFEDAIELHFLTTAQCITLRRETLCMTEKRGGRVK